MTLDLHLTRVRLRPDADIRALASLLVPDKDDARIAAGHQLAWSLFAGVAGRERDFLWREEAPGRLIVQSSAPPRVSSVLEILGTKRFAALPRAGERFSFALRANPTTALGRSGRDARGKFRRGQTIDVIMHALHATPGRRGPDGRMLRPLRPGEGRAAMREALLGWRDAAATDEATDPRRPALDWLARQGERRGFALDRDATKVVAYRRVALPRRGEDKPVIFGQVDYEGALTVTDAAAFADTLRSGLGRAKAFGCGLVLLARAPAREAPE